MVSRYPVQNARLGLKVKLAYRMYLNMPILEPVIAIGNSSSDYLPTWYILIEKYIYRAQNFRLQVNRNDDDKHAILLRFAIVVK